MENNVIESFDKFLKILPGVDFWYRGHSTVVGELRPKAFRKGMLSESFLYNSFKLRAPAYYQNCPSDTDNYRWLCLMQHYGLPTRLLDWTTNPLYALYFAVRNTEELSVDGELWFLEYLRLNSLSKMRLPLVDTIELQYLCDEGFYARGNGASEKAVRDELKKARHLSDEFRFPISVFPVHGFERMKAQQSTFTIHPYESIDTNWQNIRESGVTKYIIPAEAKPEFLITLRKMGIREAAIFPSLESLSKDIMSEYD